MSSLQNRVMRRSIAKAAWSDAFAVLGLALVLCVALPGAVLAQTPDTIGLFRGDSPAGSNTFYILNLNALVAPVNVISGFGNAGDVPVVGDWDGDGITTIGVFRSNVPPGSNTFYLREINSVGEAGTKVESIGQAGRPAARRRLGR